MFHRGERLTAVATRLDSGYILLSVVALSLVVLLSSCFLHAPSSPQLV